MGQSSRALWFLFIANRALDLALTDKEVYCNNDQQDADYQKQFGNLAFQNGIFGLIRIVVDRYSCKVAKLNEEQHWTNYEKD